MVLGRDWISDADKKSRYRSQLYRAEASSLVGEIVLGLSESEIEISVNFSRPGRAGRGADIRIQSHTIRDFYTNNYRNRVNTLRDLILDEVVMPNHYDMYSPFEISNDEMNPDRIKDDIRRATTELARLASEL